MAKTRRKQDVKLLGVVRRKRAALLVSTALCVTFVMVVSMPGHAQAQPAPNARPTGGVVTAGSASISQSTNETTINQSTNRAAVNWQSFDVGSQQAVQFNQPTTSSVTLNRVVGPNPSQIAGQINANGQVVLVNQSGVVFYKGSQVNTAGLMVSAAGISNQNFMAGKMVFDQPAAPNAQIVNQGNITIKQAGLAALVAPEVVNSGVIDAKLGHVVLAGASKATLDFYGDGLVSVDVSGQVTQAPNGATALVTNTGIVRADGGTVQLTARAVDGIVTNLVDAGGTISANTAGGKTGTVALNGVGGSIIIDGQVAATGSKPGTTGGNIVANATGNVVVTSKARIDASGKAGGGTVAIGTTLVRAKGGPSVTAKHTAANVAIQSDATIAANATANGNGGRVTVLSTGTTTMAGEIDAKGGPAGGNGGFVEVSGGVLALSGFVDTSAPRGTIGTLLLDPSDLYISDTEPTAATYSIVAGDLPTVAANKAPDSTTVSWVSPTLLAAQNSDISLAATDNLFVATTNSTPNTLNLGTHNLTLIAGTNLTVDRGFTIDAGNVSLTATTGAITLSGSSGVTAGLITSGQIGGLSATSVQSTNLTMSAATGIALADATIGSSGTPITTLDLSNATSGGVTQSATGTIFATTLQSTSNIAGGLTLTAATNQISNLGAIKVTSGNIAIEDAAALTIGGLVNAAGNVYLEGAAGITFGASRTIESVSGGTIGLQTSSLTNLGTTGATGVVNAGAAGTFELSPDTANIVTLGSAPASGLSLTNLTGITAGLVRIGAVTQPGNVSATTIANAISITGAFGSSATNFELDASGAVTQTAALTASTLSGSATSYTLTKASNAITTLGPLTASGTIAIMDASAMTIGGAVQSTAGNVYLEDSAAGGITFGAFTVSSQSGGVIGLQTNALVNLGTTGATGVVNAGAAGTFELSPDTANAVTLGSNSGLSLTNLTGITAGLVRIGAVTQPGNVSATTIANAISITGAFGSSATNFELDASGAVTQTAALTASTLSGSATSYTLTKASNAITTLGPLTASGTIAIMDASAMTIGGAVQSTAGNVYLEDSAAGGITFGAFTVSSQSGGVIGLQTNALVNLGTTGATGVVNAGAAGTFEISPDTANIVTLGSAPASGLSLTNLTGITAGLVRIGAVTQPGNVSATTIANAISITGAFGSSATNFELDASGAVTQTAALTASTLSGSATSYTLTKASNAITTLGPLTASGTIAIMDASAMTIGGAVQSTAGNVYLEDSAAGGITFGAFTVSSQSGGVIGLQTNALVNLGTTGATGVVNAGAAGTFELSPDTANAVTLGSNSGLSLTNLTGITAGLVRIGAVTQPGGSSATIIANAISIAGAFGNSSTNLELDTTGAVTQAAVLTANTLTGTVNSGTLTTAGNAITTLGNFAVTNDISLTDTGSMAVAGTVTATNIILNAPTIGVSGSIGATTDLALVAGSGGIALNAGEVLTGATVDLSAANGGVTQVSTGTISATSILQSTSGVTGTVDLIGTANTVASVGSFAVATGSDFTLVGTGNVGLAGVLTATNISVSAPTITATGSVGATTDLALVAGSGGIALNSGHILTGATVDLSATGGGVTQTAAGTIAATVLQSTSNVTAGVALLNNTNTITDLGPLKATSGNIAIADTHALTIAGGVTASSGNVYLNDTAAGGIIFNAFTVTSKSGGTVGLKTDALTNLGTTGSTGAIDAGSGMVELAPNTQGNAVTLGSASGLSLTNLTGITAGTLRVGAVTVPGSGLTTMAGSIAVAGAAFDGTGLTKLELDATTTGGGTGNVGQSTALLNIATLTGTAASYTLTNTSNTIGALGPLSATSGNIAIKDATAMTIAGAVAATHGNVYLEDSAAGGITFGAFAVSSQPAGLIGLQTNALVNLGTTGATGAANAGAAGTFELSPDTANAVTLGAASGLSLSNLTGITAGLVRIGAVTQPGNGSPTTIANAISIAGAFGSSSTSLELDANGAVGQSAALTAATLSGSATSYTLTNASNAISTLGPLAASGTIAINDTSALTIGGAVGSTGGNVYLEDSAAGGITFGAFTVSSQSGGVIGLQTNALLNLGTTAATGAANAGATGTFELSPDTAHAVTLGASSGLSLANLTRITAGTLRIGAVTQPGNASATTIANAISIAGAFGSGTVNLELDATGAVGQSAAVTAAGLSGSATSYTLTTASNSISTLGPLTASGTIAVKDATALTLGGTVHSTAGNVYLEDSAGGGIDLASYTVSSQTGGVIGLQTNTLLHLGATGAINAGAAGTFELSPDTANPVTLGSASGLSLTDFSGITAGTVRVGAVTQPGSVSPTVIANAINIAGAFGNGTTNLELDTSGAITQAAVLTAQTLTGTAGSFTLTLSNVIATLGSFSTTNNFSLTDAGSLAVAGPVTAANVVLNAATIGVGGSIGATTSLALVAGLGGIALNSGEVLSGATVDLSATNGGVTQVAGGTITATAVLQSTSGVTGTVNLAGTSNAIASVGSFQVLGGDDFTLVDTGDLTLAGKLTATNISLSSPTITATGSVGATGVLTLVGAAGGITLNSGEVLSGATVDLSSSGGAVTQAAGGSISATVLQSTSGFANGVTLNGTTNAIGTLAAMTASAGNIGIVDAGSSTLIVNAALKAPSGNIYLNENLSPGTIDFTATGSAIAVASGIVGLQADTFSAATGFSISAATLELAPNAGGAFAIGAGSGLGVSGISVGTVRIGAITLPGSASPTTTATSIAINSAFDLGGANLDLRTSGAVTQSAALTGVNNLTGSAGSVTLTAGGNAITDLGSFAATGSFALTDTGNMIVSGPVTGANIALTSATITATGSIGTAGTTATLLLNATSGAILLNAGEVLAGATVDLSATGGVAQVAGGIIHATTVLQSTSSVTDTVDLAGTANTIASVGSFAVTTGDFTLLDTGNLTAAGKLTATNISLTSATITATGSVGAIGATGVLAVTSGAGGIALNTGAVLTGPTIDLNGSSGGIALTGNASLGGSGALVDVTTTGGIAEAATGIVTAGTLRSTSGVTGTVDLAGTANAVANLGNFPVTNGNFTLVDSGSLAVPGTVTANNITLSTNLANQISATGSLGAGTLVAVTSGSGGIALNTGAVLTGPTIDLNGNGGPVTLAAGSQLGQTGDIVDVSTSGGGVNENAAATIIAATLRSTSGVTDTVDLAGTANTIASVGSFAVTTGDFTLLDTGNLTAAGKLTATNISLTSATITATGSVGAIGATGVLAVASGAGGIALNTGAVLTGPTIDLNGSSGGIALTGNASLGGSGALVDVTTTGGIAEAATGIVTAGTLRSTSGVTGTVDLAGTANAVANLGNFPVTNGDFTLVDTGSLAVPGTVTANNITLSTNVPNQISATGSLGAGTLVAVTSGSGGLALNTGAVVTAPTIDLNGSSGGIALTGNASLGGSGALVDVTTTGGIAEAATGIVTAGTLRSTSGVTGTVDLAGTANAVANLGNFPVTTGDFTLVDTGSLAVPGTVTANNITLSTNLANQISATGSLGAGTLVAVTSGSGGIALNTGAVLTGPTIDLNGNGGPVTLAAGSQLGQTGDIVDVSTSGGGVNENAAATIIAATLRSTSGVTDTVDLAGTANTIASVGSFAVTTGDFTLLDTGNLTAAGKLTATNISLTSATITATGSVGAIGVTGVLAVTSGAGGIALNTGAVLTGPTIDLNGSSGGIALTGNASLGGSGALVDVTTTGGIAEAATGIVTAGTLRSTSGVTGTVDLAGTANAVANLGNFPVTNGDFTLVDTGSLAVPGTVTANNITLSTNLANQISATGSLGAGTLVAVTSGSGGIALNTGAVLTGPTIDLNGNGGPVTLAAGSQLGQTGDIVDVSTSGGGVNENAAATIIAATLRSTSGVTDTVDLAGTSNAVANLGNFPVTTGDFTLVDTGSLAVPGTVTANNITLSTNVPNQISATGSLAAGTLVAVTSGSGGIALNTGAVLTGPTIDLNGNGGPVTLAAGSQLGQTGDIVDVSTSGGGVNENAAATIIAATLRSTLGVTDTVDLAGTSNAVANLGNFRVAGGDFTLVDTGSLAVPGTVTANNITLSTNLANQISATGSLGAGTLVAVTSGSGGIALNTGAVLTGPTIDLNGNGGPVTLAAGSQLGQTGDIVDVSTSTGGVNENAAATIIAATLRSTLGVTDTVDLAGTSNAVANLGNFRVAGGDFTLVDTGSLAVPGTVTANNITLSTNVPNQISATGSLGAGTLVAVTSGSGGIALNTGAVLTGPTIDLNGNGGPVTLAAGSQLGQTGDIVDVSTSGGGVSENAAATIIAATLRSTLGVTGTVGLLGTANAIASLADFTVTGAAFTLVDTGPLAVPGTVTATNITLSTNGTNQISATGSLDGGTVVAVTSGSGGIALGTGAVVTAPTIDLNGNGGAITLTGNASVGTSTALVDLTTSGGGVSEASTSVLNAGTLQSAAGVTGSVALLGTANAVNNVGMFGVGSGDFTLIDNGTVGLRGPVSAGNVTVTMLNKGGIAVTGSVTAKSTIGFTSGLGGVTLSTGAVVSAPTIDVDGGGAAFAMINNATLGNGGALVDLTTSGGGVSEAATSVITAATLQSTLGVTGNVNLLGTNNAIANLAKFIVTSGSLDLVDTGSLALGGPIGATSITANTVGSGAITASGIVTSTGTLSLTSGTGGIRFGAGAVVSASTIDLNGDGGAIALTGNAVLGGSSEIVDVTTTAGGMSEAASSVINSATLLSGSGVTGNVSLLGTSNAVANVAGFTVTTGNFTLVDTGSLGVLGPLSATNVTLSTTGGGMISASGLITGTGSVVVTSGAGGISLGSGAVVSAPTIDLNGAGGAIALSGGAAVNGATLVDLTTTAGGVSEAATSSIATALLQSAAGVTGNVTLSGSSNAVTNLGTFVVTGGSLALVDTGSLAIAGPVSATNVTASTTGAGAISASGGVTATNTLALTSGTGGIALGTGAVLDAPTIDLNGSGGAITLTGNAIVGTANVTALVDLATSNGGISEASTSEVLTATLQSADGVTGTATFAGTANVIGTLANFIVSGGNLSLLDTANLSVTGPVQANNVTLTGAGATAINVSGTLGAASSGGTLSVTSGAGGIALGSGAVLGGSVIMLNGNGGAVTLTGNATVGSGSTTLDLDTTGGGVNETAGASMLATTLHSSLGVTGSVALSGSANAIAALGSFAVTGGSFSLSDTGNLAFNGPVSASSVSASTNGIGGIGVNAAVTANATPSGAVTLASGTGGIDINSGGVLTGPTVDLSTTGGGITESGGGNLVATTLQSSGGVTGAVSLPVTSVGTVGTFIVAAGSGAFSMFDSVPVTIAATGRLSADSVSLDDHGNIIIAGALTDPANGTVTLISDTGSITEPNTGTLVAALLTGSSALGTDLSGNGYVNNIGTLGNFVANAGTFTLHDGANLLINGTITAGTIIINDNNGTGQITLANGAGFVTGGETRPSNGTILFANLPSSTSGVGGAYLIVGNFVQDGSSFVTPLNGTAAILDIDASGNISFDAGTGLVAPATWLELNLAGGQATGAIDVQELDISYVSASASAALTAEIDGFSGNAAAGRAFIVPEADTNFRVNACPVHSINCVLLPTQTLPTASPLNDFFVGSMFSPADQGDLLLPIVSNGYMESLTAPGFGSTNPNQQDCDKDPSQPACKE